MTLAATSILTAAATAASPVIGVATANGTFQLDGNSVTRNATVLEGSKIATEKASSLVQLNSGARLSLAANSGTQIFQNRAILERGTGQISTSGRYSVEAGRLRIEPLSNDSEMRVNMGSGQVVQVAAVRGNLVVKNTTGIILASLHPGTALAFDDSQDAGASLGISVSGVLHKASDRVYVLTDSTSNITYQIVGCDDLNSKKDKNVRLDGTLVQNASLAQPAIAAGATQEVRVRSCTSVVALAAGAAAAAGIGLSTTAIIAGVGVAAAGTGIGLGVALSQGTGTASASGAPQ